MNIEAYSSLINSFSSALSLSCEGAYYDLSRNLNETQAAHLDSLFELVGNSILDYCKLPLAHGSVSENLSSIHIDPSLNFASRGASAEGLPYLSFQVSVKNAYSSPVPANLVLGMLNDHAISYALSLTDGNTFKCSNQFSIFNSCSLNTPDSINSIAKFLTDGNPINFYFPNLPTSHLLAPSQKNVINDACSPNKSCIRAFINQTIKGKITKNVHDFVTKAMGGLDKLCSFPRVESSAEDLHSKLREMDTYNIVGITPYSSELSGFAFRICQAAFSFSTSDPDRNVTILRKYAGKVAVITIDFGNPQEGELTVLQVKKDRRPLSNENLAIVHNLLHHQSIPETFVTPWMRPQAMYKEYILDSEETPTSHP